MTRLKPGLTIPDEMKSDRKQTVKKGCCSTCGVVQTEDNSVRRLSNSGGFDSGCTKCTALTSHIRSLLDHTPEKLHRLMERNLEIARRIHTVIHTKDTRPSEIGREHYKSEVRFVIK